MPLLAEASINVEDTYVNLAPIVSSLALGALYFLTGKLVQKRPFLRRFHLLISFIAGYLLLYMIHTYIFPPTP